MGIQERKDEHLKLFKAFDLSDTHKSNGFEAWDWIPNETADISLDEIDTVVSFLGYKLSYPFMIAAISGGTDEGNRLNMDLADVAESEKIPLGTGSVRCALDRPEQTKFFYRLRDAAPNVPLVANIGIAQMRTDEARNKIYRFMKESRYDALAIHFNKIQEIIQKDGDRDFKGIRDGLKALADTADFTLIAKGVGHGFSHGDILSLFKAGIRFIDTGGAGGTSWAKVERFRNGNTCPYNPFDSWGIPTAECLRTVLNTCPAMYPIAGGGINDGFDMAKALALGCELVSAATSVYKTWLDKGKEGVKHHIQERKTILEQIMFLTGCRKMGEFRGNPTILRRRND